MHTRTAPDPIAIVGFAGIFPGAANAERLWRNIVEKRDGIGQVPGHRWILAAKRVHTGSVETDRAVSTRAGLIRDFDFDPEAYRLGAERLRRLDPLHHLALATGKSAWGAIASDDIDPRLAGVILSAIALPTDSASRLCWDLLGSRLAGSIFKERRQVPFDSDAAMAARVTGFPAAIVAHELSFGGVAYTLDAACASSLYAVKLACDELRAGRADVMLAGGASRPDALYTQIGFSQLRALSPSGRCAAFDAGADGLVVGEGCGILALKRIEDALAQGDRIWGVIRGLGLSNDMRGNLLAPDSEGQLRAMTAAYEQAGWRPDQVDLIECHGAGTKVGDQVEIESLHRLWSKTGAAAGACPIGSVKTVTGHLLVAAGAAGLIKTLLAMEKETLPPSLHFSAPPQDSPLLNGPFRVQTEAAPWPRRDDATPRRAAVSAFGFGGINAHLLIEEWMGKERKGKREKRKAGPNSAKDDRNRYSVSRIQHPDSRIQVAVVGMAAAFGKAADLVGFSEAVSTGADLKHAMPPGRWKQGDGSGQAVPGYGRKPGAFIEALSVPIGEFKIPPSEIPDILPQHLLMLRVARSALSDAGIAIGRERPDCGAVVGIDFDCEATNFHLRWRLDAESTGWFERLGIRPSDPEAARWLESVKDACSPPLNANRTLGALAGVIGSRIARECLFGGPSFTVSEGPVSGLRALEIAARTLAAGEAEVMVAGAVDFAGDIRASWIASSLDQTVLPGDGAAAVVVKRLDRARADGDRIYAVLRGTGTAGGAGLFEQSVAEAPWNASLSLALTQAEAQKSDIELLEITGKTPPPATLEELPAPAGIEEVVGTPGAATGMAALVRAVLCLHERRLPSGVGIPPKKWPAPAAGAPRRACVAASAPEGSCMHLIFEEGGPQKPPKQPISGRGPETYGDAIVVPVGGCPIVVPEIPQIKGNAEERRRNAIPPSAAEAPPMTGKAMEHTTETNHTQKSQKRQPGIRQPGQAPLQSRPHDAGGTTARAHEKFLAFSKALGQAYTEAIDLQLRLIDAAGESRPRFSDPAPPSKPPAYDRSQCMEFAIGSAARVLGPEFAELDGYRVRVRLPDEPLMLVDRIVSVEGEKGSLSCGQVVTEHDVLPGGWYLDGGKAPVCISVEAGQADLFLCSYLGIDLKVKGERAYRLLDATVSFHRGLPEPGDTIRYEIEIEKFVRQADTWLFFFHFSGTIDDRPLITMTDGCAGFFTPEEVENSGGILLAEEESRPQPGTRPESFPVPVARESYGDEALASLRAGDARRCFGPAFAGVSIPEPLQLPGGRMHLIDRILEIDPDGGVYAAGMIRAEADIHPDDWFLTCHFVDDMVMPGTLMYECCAHTLRVFLQRIGWFTDSADAVYEPKPGIKSVLKCRGPVTPRTRKVVYEVQIRELGFDPQPYALADAHMFADGRRIVMFRDMSMQVSGLDREKIDAFWKRGGSAATRPSPVAGRDETGRKETPRAAVGETRKPVFTREQILAFTSGRPSETFGPRFAPFDESRFLARLPRPPYSFIDRVVRADPPPQVMAPGGWVEAEFEVRPDAWYFAANRSASMPLAVLQEAALQVCGFTAAYAGSSLTSEKALRFRNLGGEAVQHRDVGLRPQVLTTRCRMTRVDTAAEMIIQNYEMAVVGPDGDPVYEGTTHFGFFTDAALSRQVGIPDADAPAFGPDPEKRKHGDRLDLEKVPPLFPEDPNRTPSRGPALPSAALLMIDKIDLFVSDGGPQGLGYIRGEKRIDPGQWFFAAHFYQDPVCPGSLGLESFLQLLKFAAIRRFETAAENRRFAPVLAERHRWTYRGQILPTNGRVTVEASITRTACEPDPLILADGILRVDGLAIYRMENFGIRLISDTL